jgi:Na+-translocating ferredoxin:NAD+ oxidoreductase RNF subunit RnfB
MGEVATAIAVMTGLGLFFSGLLAVAYRFLRVEEDPRLEVVEELLPGNNCGACGEPGCSAFAGKLITGDVSPGKCTVADGDTLEEIAAFLGVGIGAEEKRIARLKCAGGLPNVRALAQYQGMSSCQAAAVVDGGGLGCAWGCLGLGDCERVCTFDALRMNEDGLPSVDPEPCTACGDCVEVCPLDLFVLVPESQKVFVQCNTPLEGEAALRGCRVACDTCGRCAADAPADTVEIVNGLPIVHYDRAEQPGPEATWRCPTGAITWLEGKQFVDSEEEDAPPWRAYG